MEIKKIACDFSVCKVKDYSLVDLTRDLVFCFTGKTDEENSLACPEDKVPSNVTERDDGWKAFRIQGILDSHGSGYYLKFQESWRKIRLEFSRFRHLIQITY